MKVIDILNKIADGTLEDGFKFKRKDDSYIWEYNKNKDYIIDEHYYNSLEEFYNIFEILNDEVEVIEDVKEIEEIEEIEIKEDYNREEFITSATGEKIYIDNITEEIIINKINELVQAVNQLRKDKTND